MIEYVAQLTSTYFCGVILICHFYSLQATLEQPAVVVDARNSVHVHYGNISIVS